jgi:threonine synthase
MSEGKKTAVFEICEQMNWKTPDTIFVSVGDGCIIGGLHKGLKDLQKMGWIEKIPRLIGVQAEGSDFMYQAWKSSEDLLKKKPIIAKTVADSISAGLPRDRIKAMAAVRDTNGAFIRVSDEEILKAIPELAKRSGVFAEPAGAASYAGLKKAVKNNLISRDDSVVLLVTGNGLKDTVSAMKSTELCGNNPFLIDPDMEDVKSVIHKIALD